MNDHEAQHEQVLDAAAHFGYVDPDVWLAEQAQADSGVEIFWAPCHWSSADDWSRVRGAEHLAVLISTAVRSDNNVCFVSSARGRVGRSVNVIGLISRPVLGWAVVLRDAGVPGWGGDVKHADYAHDNYESFGALGAAEIALAWVRTGRLPEGLTYTKRAY